MVEDDQEHYEVLESNVVLLAPQPELTSQEGEIVVANRLSAVGTEQSQPAAAGAIAAAAPEGDGGADEIYGPAIELKKGKKKKKKGSGGITEADVGCRVTVAEYDCEGTLKFVGHHAESGKPRCGVELDEPVGKNDGTIKGPFEVPLFPLCSYRSTAKPGGRSTCSCSARTTAT